MEQIYRRGANAGNYFLYAALCLCAWPLLTAIMSWRFGLPALYFSLIFCGQGVSAALAGQPPAERKSIIRTVIFVCIVLAVPLAFAFGTRQAEFDTGIRRSQLYHFARIRPVIGGAKVTAGRLYILGLRPGASRVLKVGSTFTQPDRHSQLTFKVLAIQPDGMWLAYFYDGFTEFRIGAVRLPWKEDGPRASIQGVPAFGSVNR